MPSFPPPSPTRRYTEKSKAELASCDPRLRRVMEAVLPHFDHTIVTGHRGQAAQDEAHRTGKSDKPWPTSKHNSLPSMAVDVAPCPINWKDRERFTFFAGVVLGTAAQMGIELRWGGDWDRDTEVADNSFDDLAHFEIVEPGP